MNVNQLRTILNDYYNNNTDTLIYFHERNNNSTNLHVHIRALMLDINLENDMFRIQTMLINRTQQIDTELRNFNNIYLEHNQNDNIMNIDPNNRWVPLYNGTLNLLRIIRVFMGLMLIDFAQININNEVVDDIMNQLGVNNIINIPPNLNEQNDINYINNDINYMNNDINYINNDINYNNHDINYINHDINN
jgi:hypothetical protein